MHPPIFYSVLFFLIRGCLIPNLDHIHYFFLTEQCGLTHDEYDMLYMSQSIGAIVGMQLFATYLTKVQTWKLIKISLWVQVIQTILMYVNLMRWNINVLSSGANMRWWSISDWNLNAILMFIDKATRHCMMKQGVLGVRLKIMLPHDPEGKNGPKTPLPDTVTIMDPKEDKPIVQAPKGSDEKAYAAPTLGGPTPRY